MKFWSVVKLVVVTNVLCSVSAFAADILSEAASGNAPCNYYVGKGVMRYENDRERAIDYLVTLKVRQLGNGMNLLDYSFIIDGKANRFPIIIDKESDDFQKVLVPTSEDTQDDYASYVETGWGHKVEYEEIHRDEGTPKKRTILLSFLDKDGKRVTEHVLAYRLAGKWQLITTGSIGDTNGVIFVYGHKLSQTDKCSL